MKRTHTKRRAVLFVLLAILLAIPLWLTYRAYRQNQLDRALITALKRDDAQTALSLLAQGADANTRDWPVQQRPFWQLLWLQRWNDSETAGNAPSALLVALPWNLVGDEQAPRPENPALIKALLDKGAEVNVIDEGRYSPLRMAIVSGNEQTALLLLKYGAKVTNTDGEAAFLYAIESGYANLVKAFLERGANPNHINSIYRGAGNLILEWNNSWRPALINSMWGNVRVDVIRALLDGGADINARDSEGRTALMWAVFTEELSENDKALSLLLKRGADVTLSAKNGDTALSVARKLGDANMTRLLRQAGAKR